MSKITPYLRLARLDKPTGIWLLYIPCLFGLLLAQSTDLALHITFALGAIIMRSAGCIINDILDRNIDRLVERTKTRPLASGELSLAQAMLFLTVLLLVGLGLLLTLSTTAIIMGISIIPFIFAYPLMKRITYYPQIFLGITFNYGLLMGYAAATGTITLAPILLYCGCIFWTIGYDTIYALQDIEDDVRVGVKSSAIAFGRNYPQFIAGSYFVFIFDFALAAGYAGLMNLPTLLGILAGAILLGLQLIKLDSTNPAICLKLFKLNVAVGLVLAAGLAI